MPLKNLKKFIKHIKEDIVLSSKKKFKKLADLIVARAKRKHRYKNRTGTLTASHGWEQNKTKINFYTVDYGKWVRYSTKENWIKKASNYYIRNPKKWRK